MTIARSDAAQVADETREMPAATQPHRSPQPAQGHGHGAGRSAASVAAADLSAEASAHAAPWRKDRAR